jgi:hypothetical protein
MLSPSPSKITDLAIPGASPRPADLAAPEKLRNTRGQLVVLSLRDERGVHGEDVAE